jgi:hypothetical protein
MEASLPSTIDFSKKLPELPSGTKSYLMSVQTSNGLTFGPSQTLQFDLPSRPGLFIDGKSVFIRYRVSYVTGTGTNTVRRKPVYTTFSRLDEYIGSVPCNSVYQYNQVANMWVDTNCNLADVYGQQFSYGLAQTASMVDLDGVALTASTTNDLYVSAPLVCSFLGGCDKLIPTGLMAPIRVQLTVDTITNIISGSGVTGISVIQPELCFSAIDFGVEVENAVAMSAPKLILKTQGWANATQSVASGTSGFNTLPFNHRYESIENLYLLSSSTSVARGINLWGDSLNVLGNSGVNGSIQATIGTDQFPVLPINNATGGIASAQQYLRECVGFITDNRNSMSILNVNYSSNYCFAGDATITTVESPAKVIFGFPLSRVNAPSPYQQASLMSGVSASATPINILLNAGTAFNTAMSFALIAQYTELIEIDAMTKQVRVIC